MELKEQGNRLFAAGRYSEAINCYSKAIQKNRTIPTFYTNRALCYLKQKQWDLVCQDCKKALEYDSCLVKGHYFNGQACLEIGLYDEAIASLIRAQELAKEQKLNFGDDITSTVRLAKKRRYSIMEEKRIQQEIELQEYLNKLIIADKQRQLDSLKSLIKLNKDIKEEAESIELEHKRRLKEVYDMFAQVDDRRKKREVPDYLCGKISFELMRDPVITPSGITYDRKDIEEHLQRVGHFDPVTRTDLTQDKLISNLAMKEVIDVFLEENPWAVDD